MALERHVTSLHSCEHFHFLPHVLGNDARNTTATESFIRSSPFIDLLVLLMRTPRWINPYVARAHATPSWEATLRPVRELLLYILCTKTSHSAQPSSRNPMDCIHLLIKAMDALTYILSFLASGRDNDDDDRVE